MGNIIHFIKWNGGSLYCPPGLTLPVLATTTVGFEQNSPNWQIQQLQRQFNEWLEGLFAPITRVPHTIWTPPEWLLRLLFWIVAVVFITWLGWQLYQVLSPYFYPSLTTKQSGSDTQSLGDRPLTAVQWWQRSRIFAGQGNYREACRCLYQAALQQLAERQLIPHQVSRTDGEYRALLEALPQREPYQVLIDIHERLCFSNTDIAATDFDQCQQAYRQIGNRQGRQND